MKRNSIKKTASLFLLITLINLFFLSFSFGAVIIDDKGNPNWKDKRAYRPAPVLFLHGFAMGDPSSWDTIVNGPKGLKNYFVKYIEEDFESKTTIPVLSDPSTFSIPYLERINFADPNGSIDTYNDGKDGWADKVNRDVRSIIDNPIYPDRLNLVCNSKGGLAAREYITNPKYTNSAANIDRLITIATPHAGTPLANIKKIEDATTGMHKYVWDIPTNERVGIKINNLELTDNVLQFLRGEVHLDPEGEDVKDMAVGSPFLKTLNYLYNQPFGIKSFAIYGETFIPLNGLFSAYYPSEPWTCGDGIIPRDSQIGIDIMTYYPDTTPIKVWSFDGITKIPVDHFTELVYEETPQKILSFLDSTPPDLEITSPDPSGITEIYESSIHVQGAVYKEYLPADTKLIITITKEGGGYNPIPQESYLKASDLWIPNDPDSPVAEFDEIISFPGSGTYKISCHAENPTGLVSDIKEVWVKVAVSQEAAIEVHCHNPEGKEIASIQWIDPHSVEIYDGNTLIGYGAYNVATHNQPTAIEAGNHTIKVKFNGITLEQSILLNSGETKILTFTFERAEIDDLLDRGTMTKSISNSRTVLGHSSLWVEDYEDPVFIGFVNYWFDNDFSTVLITLSRSATISKTHFSYSFYAKGSASPAMRWSSDGLTGIAVWAMSFSGFPINIPVRNDFNVWFIQNIISDPSTTIIPLYIYPGRIELPIGRASGNMLLPVSAKINYNQLRVLQDIFSEFEFENCPWPLTFSSYIEVSDSISRDVQGENFKMSSIPYDLTGTAI